MAILLFLLEKFIIFATINFINQHLTPMKRFYNILTIALCLLVVNTFAQQVLLQQTVTDASKGQIVLTEKASTQSPPINEFYILGGTSKSPNINWQFTDPVAVGSTLRVSEEAQKNFCCLVVKQYQSFTVW